MAGKVKWSYTAINTLRECNRKYYFSQVLATFGRTIPLRRKVYELKSMQDILRWQGSVIDKFMEITIIPMITAKQPLDFDALALQAVELAKKQFDYSSLAVYTDPFVSKKEAGPEFCILDIHELGKSWTDQQIAEAYAVIAAAVQRLPEIQMPDGQPLMEFLKACNSLSPNVNNWKVDIEEAAVKPQIDLLAMHNWKPVVMDWKLSGSYTSDYHRQLVIIGLVVYLKRLSTPEKKNYAFEDIRLYEVNLLKGVVKEHAFTEERMNQMIDEINLTSQDILLLTKNAAIPDIDDFEMTDNENSCRMCNYRSVCSYLLLNNNQYDEKSYSEFVQANQFAGA